VYVSRSEAAALCTQRLGAGATLAVVNSDEWGLVEELARNVRGSGLPV
jgi:hypothetical protein